MAVASERLHGANRHRLQNLLSRPAATGVTGGEPGGPVFTADPTDLGEQDAYPACRSSSQSRSSAWDPYSRSWVMGNHDERGSDSRDRPSRGFRLSFSQRRCDPGGTKVHTRAVSALLFLEQHRTRISSSHGDIGSCGSSGVGLKWELRYPWHACNGTLLALHFQSASRTPIDS
jgi:hypothetical protein